MDDEELNQLRQACLKSLQDKKSDNISTPVSNNASSKNLNVRSQTNSIQSSNGLMRLPSQHNSPLLPSPPLTVHQVKVSKGNVAPYNGDFPPSKSQCQVNNGHRYGGSPGSPIRYHASQQPQSTQQSSAGHPQQPHHSQQQSSSQSSQSSARHHHIPPPPNAPPVHNQGFTAAQNSFFRPNGGPPPQLGHPAMGAISPHMPGLPLPYGHQGAPPPPPPPGHPAFRSPYGPSPTAPPGLQHLPPASFHPMHAPSSFHPQAGYTPMQFAKRTSGPRHGFHNFYPNSFKHNINSGPNHMHPSNDHTPPHLQPPHLLPHGPNGSHPSNINLPINDHPMRPHFNDMRNMNHTGHRRKPFDGPNNRGSSHNHPSSSNDQPFKNGQQSTNQPRSQQDDRNSPFKDANHQSNSRSEENDSDSLKHRGPERFSRIERSDSESDEDDRLDFLGDVNDDPDGDCAEKSQDSLYDNNSNPYSNALVEDADEDIDKFDDKESVDDKVCKFDAPTNSEDNSLEHQAKRAKLM